MNAIVEAAPGGALLSFIERAARDESFDIAKFESLLRMQQTLADKQAQQAFNAAMARVESEIGPVLRDRLNPGVNRKYATLEAMDAVARPVYARHGLSVRFGCAPSPTPGSMRITCTVSHADGYSEQNYLDSPVDSQQRARSPVQAVGSTITYLRRYLLQMAFNIVLSDDELDDDGESTRRDRQAAEAYSARDALNASVPLQSTSGRAAAAATPRGARIAERAPEYETPTEPVERTDGQWQVWLDKLRAACAVLQHRAEVVEVAERRSVADALATAPAWVRSEISAILAENYKRFAEPAEAKAEDAWPGDDLAIVGEEKMASG